MPYIKKTIIFKNSIEIEKIFSGRFGHRGRHRKKEKPTPEQVMKINARMAAKKLRWKMKANFNELDDYHMVLTYKKDARPGPEHAERYLNNFIQNMRRNYRKCGYEFKYIIVTEYLNKAIHHHMIINGIPDTIKMVCKYWKYGRANFTPLYEENSFGELSEYLIKETDKTFRSGKFQKQRYRCSRNLVEPKIKVEVINSKTFRKDIRPKSGYYIDKDSVSEGVNEFGYRYQFYTMVKIERKRE